MVSDNKSTKCNCEEDRNYSNLPETIDVALTHNGKYPEIIDESFIENKLKEKDQVNKWYLNFTEDEKEAIKRINYRTCNE
jgi:hypothetical protein